MDLFPINELVRQTAIASGLSAPQLLQRLGYQNFNKGKRLMDAILAHNSLNKAHRHWRDKFFEIFTVPANEVQQAREATIAALRNISVAKPLQSIKLVAVFEQKPQGLHGHMGLYAASAMHEFRSIDPDLLLPLIKSLVLHRVRTESKGEGHTGEPIAYRLLVSPMETWVFDRTGNLIEKLEILPALISF